MLLMVEGREVQPVRGPEKITKFWAAPEGSPKAGPGTPEICRDDGPYDFVVPGNIINVVPGDLQWILEVTVRMTL